MDCEALKRDLWTVRLLMEGPMDCQAFHGGAYGLSGFSSPAKGVNSTDLP